VITLDDVREVALALPATSERTAPRGGHVQFVTNDKWFAEQGDGETIRVWHDDEGITMLPLARTSRTKLEAQLLRAWRLRATKRAVAGYDYAKGAQDLAAVFAELGTWPELVVRGVGDFAAGGRAFLHFHHHETSRHADVKEGLGWGDPIPFPLGPPPKKVAHAFYEEVRRRLDVTLEAIEAAKAQRRKPRPPTTNGGSRRAGSAAAAATGRAAPRRTR
jgi:hypothetical protein